MATLTSTGIRFASGNELNSRRDIFPTSTAWIFCQSSAPLYWTKSVANNDKALRLVSGLGGVSGGTNTFSSVMSSFNIGGAFSIPTNSTGGWTLSVPEMPVHAHGNGGSMALGGVPALYNPDGAFTGWNGGDVGRFGGWSRVYPGTGDTTPTGSRGQAHSHPFSASASLPNQPVSIAVQYVDVIVCTFDG